MRAALATASRTRFRVLHFSVQADHVHLLLAKALNRAVDRRGAVWADRYHVRRLGTPREVRYALVYVLQNWRKHGRDEPGLDPRSSAAWFTGWRVPMPVTRGFAPVAQARTWLARLGWRRHGLLRVDESPRRGRLPT